MVFKMGVILTKWDMIIHKRDIMELHQKRSSTDLTSISNVMRNYPKHTETYF